MFYCTKVQRAMSTILPMDSREILAESLDALIKSAGFTMEIAQSKIGVSKRHLMNIKKNSKAASLDMMEKIAGTFGVEPWQLIHPGKIGDDDDLAELLNLYLEADEEGRKLILMVARRERE